MRSTLATGTVLILLCSAAPTNVLAQAERFLGAWSLVEWTNERDGETFRPYGDTPAGQIIYTATGRMTAALMEPPENPRDAPPQSVAYWGSFTVDMAAGTVTHHVEGATRPRFIGSDQVRYFRFEGDNRLVLSPGGASELTWELVQ